MRMNRRNVLVGLGTIVAGGGAALGTGAFSSVEAERTVTLETSADTNALLGLEITDDTLTGSDGTSNTIAFNETDINYDALTTFTDALTLQNNSDNTTIQVAITDGSVGSTGNDMVTTSAPDSNDPAGLYLVADSTSTLSINSTDYNAIDVSDSSVKVDVVVNTLGKSSGDPLSGTGSLLFTAEDKSS